MKWFKNLGLRSRALLASGISPLILKIICAQQAQADEKFGVLSIR